MKEHISSYIHALYHKYYFSPISVTIFQLSFHATQYTLTIVLVIVRHSGPITGILDIYRLITPRVQSRQDLTGSLPEQNDHYYD